MTKFAVSILVFLASLTPVGAVAAEGRVRAVLVGVGDYLTLDADLKGPPNDVGLMAGMMLRRGAAPGDIVALTDPGAVLPDGIAVTPPDRTAILNAFSAAVEASGTGDTVLFYFSGHGTQAPDTDGDEQGGQDELFLPRDAGKWNGTAGEVENAIRDDDPAAIARQAAARGVRLVGIIDACHSATGFRALTENTGRARYLDLAMLNIPDIPAIAGASGPAPSGEFVFLYAAQSDQRAFEYPLEDGAWYGDFTRNLVNVLTNVPELSYVQLMQAVALQLRTKSGQAAQTADIEGPMASDPVFGGGSRALRRIAVSGTVLKAGSLQDITPGSEISLFAGPADTDPAGRATVVSVKATEAELELLEPYPQVRVNYGEITRRAVDVSFAVALSPDAIAKLNQLAENGAKRLAGALDFPLSKHAHSTVVPTADGFALVGRDGVLDAFGPGTSPRLMSPDISDDPVADLAIALSNHARRFRLEQALAQLSGQSPAGFALLKTRPDIRVALLNGTLRGGRCRLTDQREQATGDTRARHCDGLEITVTNSSTKAQDVTVLYVDADAGITMLWPRPSLSNRVPSGERRTVTLGLRNPSGRAVRESLLVLSVPADPGSQRTVLGALADGQMRGEADPMARWLAGLADPGSSARSLSLTPPGDDLNMYRLDLTITPID